MLELVLCVAVGVGVEDPGAGVPVEVGVEVGGAGVEVGVGVLVGHAPQSAGQDEHVSPGWQFPLPQEPWASIVWVFKKEEKINNKEKRMRRKKFWQEFDIKIT